MPPLPGASDLLQMSSRRRVLKGEQASQQCGRQEAAAVLEDILRRVVSVTPESHWGGCPLPLQATLVRKTGGQVPALTELLVK